MVAISKELTRLHGMYEDFIHGRVKWTASDARQFGKELSFLAVRSAIEELGVDTTVIDVARDLESNPNSNLVLFPTREQLRNRLDGGAA